MMQPRVVILKEGTDKSQGKGQLLSNITAVQAVTDILKSTLGPRGMDKLITGEGNVGAVATISNDGATILSLLDIVHPAAKVLVDIAKSQDDVVGDGTTSVTLICGQLLTNMKPHIEFDNMPPRTIIKGFTIARQKALEILGELAVPLEEKDAGKRREMLIRCAQTALTSKLISNQKEFFSEMVVDAVMCLDELQDIKNIGIKKISGGSVTDSLLVKGVAFKKTFAYAGFEQQPKRFENPKIVLLNVELELKAERTNAEIRVKNPEEFQKIVEAEWKIIFDKLQLITDSGAKIVLSKLPIGDLATQFFADRQIFCAGRVHVEDLDRVASATGARVQTSLQDLTPDILGNCELFEEKQVGGERYNLFTGCPARKSCTLILRGGAEQFIAETERSLHDAIMIVKRASSHTSVVGGGGAIEMEISKRLRAFALTIKSKQQLVISAYARALEVIPTQLAENAGFDSNDILNELRAQHANGNLWSGVDIENEGVCNTLEAYIWEPVLVKQNALNAATEAALTILSVDETIKSADSEGVAGDEMPANAMGMQQAMKM